MGEYDNGIEALYQGYYDGTTQTVEQILNTVKAMVMTADHIKAGTIDANIINVTNLNANNITTGTLNAAIVNVTNINASNIVSGTIDAGIINVTNLNASNITAGTITGNRISGGTISGVTVNVDTDLTVGNSIFIGTQTALHALKKLQFSLGANINNPANTDDLRISMANLTIDDGNVYIGLNTADPFTLDVYHATTFRDTVNFIGAVTGLDTNSTGSHSHGGYTGSAGGHNHGIADGTQLLVNGGGYVTWVSAGSHSHTISSDGSHSHTVS